MPTLLALAVAAFCCLSPQAPAGPAETVDAFHSALSAGDRDAALGLLDPDVVIFEGGGAEMSRQEYASHHLGGDMQFSAAMERELIDRQEHVAGQVAWILSRTRTTGSFRDREIDSLGVETMILRRQETGWKIVHVHWSSRRASGD